jgi:hypothetical protein
LEWVSLLRNEARTELAVVGTPQTMTLQLPLPRPSKEGDRSSTASRRRAVKRPFGPFPEQIAAGSDDRRVRSPCCACAASPPARRKVLRRIKKHKEHAPCHTNPHHPSSARSASISVGIVPSCRSRVAQRAFWPHRCRVPTPVDRHEQRSVGVAQGKGVRRKQDE